MYTNERHHTTISSDFPSALSPSRQATHNYPCLKASTTSLFAFPFIPLTFHLPNRFSFTQLYRTGSAMPPVPIRLNDALKGLKKKKNWYRSLTQPSHIIWSLATTRMDITVNLFYSQFTMNVREISKEMISIL